MVEVATGQTHEGGTNRVELLAHDTVLPARQSGCGFGIGGVRGEGGEGERGERRGKRRFVTFHLCPQNASADAASRI